LNSTSYSLGRRIHRRRYDLLRELFATLCAPQLLLQNQPLQSALSQGHHPMTAFSLTHFQQILPLPLIRFLMAHGQLAPLLELRLLRLQLSPSTLLQHQTNGIVRQPPTGLFEDIWLRWNKSNPDLKLLMSLPRPSNKLCQNVLQILVGLRGVVPEQGVAFLRGLDLL